MRLYVYVLEARDLRSTDSYVKLRVGKFKSKTRILRGTQNPVWNEEFVFKVHDADEDLLLSLLHPDEDPGFFNASVGLLGRVKVPVWSVAAEDKLTLPPTWFSLESPKSGKFADKDCGKILISASLHGRGLDPPTNHTLYELSNANIEDSKELERSCKLSEDIPSCKSSPRKKSEGKPIMKAITNRLEKLFSKNEESSATDDCLSEVSTTVSDYEDCIEERPPSCTFEEAIESMQSRGSEKEMPENLQGGILLNQAYVVAPNELNRFLFRPNSQFRKELAELQGVRDLQEGPWIWKPETTCLTRVVSYLNPPTRLVKAVKATEEQTYVRADRREFAITVCVSTPDVPYGNTFKVELLYKILCGPELSSGEESSRLVVSWGVNFHKSTMMKSMIEGGVRQGLTDSFDQFVKLLAQNFKLLDALDVSDKDHMLATLQTEHQSDWALASQYFSNFTVLSTIFMVLFFLLHILLRKSGKAGLEFDGLDLPDSLAELIACGVLFTQLERVYNMVLHFTQARLQRGSDHGVKAQGDGWVLTVALIEGANLASTGSTGLSDPYVVFTCNGKTRTSSVKLQTRDPQWKEILEFDAMEEPPSVLDVEVYDFDGPFDQASSLGHAEINFLKHTSTELADMWLPLDGKLAQSSESKLHMRIFLDNSKGVETIKEYLTKMEKEVGKKLSLRSPQRNMSFQKLFGLPQEEFLVSDFTCQLKRKLPLQGRLFLSARIMGFHANLFGYKTKFFLLWEDIENIHILPPTLATVGSPSLVVVVRKGRGLDARHGAKCHDDEGRLKFYFQSFVSFNVASRTIMALWRTRILDPDQEVQTQEELQDREDALIALEDGVSAPEAEGAKSFKIYSAELPISVKLLILEMFGGGKLEKKIMEKSGCLDYATSTWEPVKDGASQRHVSYKFNRHVSIFGGEVSSMQLKSPISIDGGWIVDEVMGLHSVPFGDCFRVHFKYQIEKSCVSQNACKCDVYIWITWLTSTKFEQRIARNIIEKFTHRVKEIFELAEREILLSTQINGSFF